MKLVKYKNLIIGICIGVLISNVINVLANDTIQAYIAKHNLFDRGEQVNELLNHPLISYKDTTYIAVRDMANLTFRTVSWDEKNNEINLWMNKNANKLINSEETISTISNAILNERYSDKLTDDTYIRMYYHIVESPSYEDYYRVNVLFDSTPMISTEIDDIEYLANNYDVEIRIYPTDCRVAIYERQLDNSIKKVMP